MKSFLRILGVASLLALASLPPLMGLDPDNGMTVDPVTKVATFSWKSEPGFTYFVQTSTDLKTWQYLNYIQSGDGGSLSVHFDANAAPRLFCRLRYTDYPVPAGTDPRDMDFDGDGFTNQQELDAGTDPFDPNSFPVNVVSANPQSVSGGCYNGYPAGQPVIIYLNQPLPADATITGNWVSDTSSGSAVPVSGTTTILPGGQAVAFVPDGNSFTPWEGSITSPPPSYQIDFTTETTGLSHIAPYHASFTTASNMQTASDSGLWVSSTSPGDGFVDTACGTTITAQWSAPLNPATVDPANVSFVSSDGSPVAFSIGFDYGKGVNRLSITPSQALAPATTYTVTLGTGFQNLSGMALAQPVSWSFTTRPVRPVPVPGGGPYVTNVTPPDFSFNIAPPASVSVTFSEDMDPDTLIADNIHLQADGGPDLPGTFTYDEDTCTLVFTPDAPFTYSTYYELTFDTGSIFNDATVDSGERMPLQGNNTFVFSTGAPGTIGSGGGGSGTGGDGGGNGGGAGGVGNNPGTYNPDTKPSFQLNVTWGDPDGDSGCYVTINVKEPGGAETTTTLKADPTKVQTTGDFFGPDVPDGSVVLITPHYAPGTDSDEFTELQENTVTVRLASLVFYKSNYLVFRETPNFTEPASIEYLGNLVDGSFVAGFSSLDCYTSEIPQTLILVPVPIQRKLDAPGADYVSICGSIAKALPGQQINLRLDTSKIPQGFTPCDFNWYFTGDENGRFNNYKMDNAQAIVTPLSDSLNQQEFSFYWSETGVHTITATCQLSEDISISTSEDINVVRPGSTLTATIMGVVDKAIVRGTQAIQLVPNGQYGIAYSGFVSSLVHDFGSEGKWAFVQLVNDQSQYASSTCNYQGNHNGFVLDTFCPYEDLKWNTGGGIGGIRQNGDSPSFGLLPDAISAGVNDNFELYLMLMPPGDNSRWVPLLYIPWEWSFAATKASGDWPGNWNINNSSATSYNTSTYTYKHPIWNDNIMPFRYIPSN